MKRLFLCSLGLLTALAAPAQPNPDPGSVPPGPSVVPRWKAAADESYLQEVGRKVPTGEPLTSVATHEGVVYAGSPRGLFQLAGDKLVPVLEVHGAVHRLRNVRGALWVLTASGLVRRDGAAWKEISAEHAVDVGEHLNGTVVATAHDLWRAHGDGLEKLSSSPCPAAIAGVASYGETLYALGAGELTLYAPDPLQAGAGRWDSDKVVDWGELSSPATRDLLALGNRLVIATDRGLGVLRGMALTQVRGSQGLCYEDTTCLAAGFADDLWIGTRRGAIRQVGDQFQYFAGQRWLPDDKVNAVATGAHAVYIATDRGLGVIEYQPYTLLKKAAFYERHLEEWGQKRLGFVHKLEWDPPLQQYVREISDNDGGYSTDYLVAQSYRYAVTKDPAARAEAANTFQAIRWLVAMTALPGFPARAVWVKGETGHKAMHGSGGYPAEWHDTADPRFEWKGDTSSDELCAHFYALAIFLDLAAQGREVEQAKDLLARMAGHLVDHGWKLIDLDNEPTRWGRWDLEYFTTTPDGAADRGLDSLEILSFMKTAETLTGDSKFARGYQQLLKLDYPAATLRQRKTFPLEDIVPFDDELAFHCYFNLVRYERDPALRSLYRRSLERSWEIVRIEQIPWFNFMYGALTGNECEVGPAVAHLREWPLDLVIHSYQNSHRTDLETPPGYVSYTGKKRAFSPREREPMLWDNWSMKPDGGTGGHDVVQPSSWLMAYWMGRYYGFIQPPPSGAPTELAKDTSSTSRGAKPYAGPPRPSNF